MYTRAGKVYVEVIHFDADVRKQANDFLDGLEDIKYPSEKVRKEIKGLDLPVIDFDDFLLAWIESTEARLKQAKELVPKFGITAHQ